MPFGVDRFGQPVYPVTPFGFGAVLRAPYRRNGDDYDDGNDDDYGGNSAGYGRRVARPLQNWSGAPPQPMNVGDGDAASPTWRPGGFTPVPAFPDVFAPWRKGAIESIGGLLHAVRPYSNLSGMGADDRACLEEWAAARKWCKDKLDKAEEGVRPERGVGYRNIEDCARGEVSTRCGGNNRADEPPEPPLQERPPKPDESDFTDCDKEWNAARRWCRDDLASRNSSTAGTGGYKNIEDCARGRVSELCRGGSYEREPELVKRRFNVRTGKWTRIR